MRLFFVAAVCLLSSAIDGQNIFTIAGIGHSHRSNVDSEPALSVPLAAPYAMLIDNVTGRLIFNDSVLVLRLEPDGTLLTIAGGGPVPTSVPHFTISKTTIASALTTEVLRGMVQDSSGAIYVSDAIAGVVYRIALDGTVTTFAGGGSRPQGAQSDGGLATDAALVSPRGLVFDSKGNLDIAEVFCNCIRQVSPTGIISTLYTLPVLSTSRHPSNLEGLAIDAQDNLYVSEWFDNQVVKIAANGSSATVIAGTGVAGFSGDGGPATSARVNGPSGLTLDQSGNLYIADSLNNRIRKVAPDGTISTIVGDGTCAAVANPLSSTQICLPASTLFDSSGALLIAQYQSPRVVRVGADGTLTTIAGNGQNDSLKVVNNDGDPALRATFFGIGGTAEDQMGNLFVSDSAGNVIRKIAPDGTISLVAGTGQSAYSGDGGPAKQAALVRPGPLAFGPDGALYVITGDSRVRKITADGRILLVAGTGTGSGIVRSQGDGGPAVNATLNEPGEVAFDKQGNIYIADTANARVRKIDKNGIISTVVGPGLLGVDYYNGVAFDGGGNLYFSWTHFSPPIDYSTLNRVASDGSLTIVAGSRQPCDSGGLQFTGDGQTGPQVRLCAITSLATDLSGNIVMAEGWYSLLIRLNPDGTLQRLAGNTSASLVGDGGPAVDASLFGGQGFSPEEPTFDLSGNIFFGEPGLNLVREVTSTPYSVQTSPAQVVASGFAAASQKIVLVANFTEPFPYKVSVTTANGLGWLSVNRATGQMGEPITVTFNPSRLAPGLYRGTVSVTIFLADGKSSKQVDIPVTLTLP